MISGCDSNAGESRPDPDVISQYNFNAAALESIPLIYTETGNPDGALVVWVHGTPGNRMAFESYLHKDELARRYRLISIDRPGWGGNRSNGQTEILQLSAQADLLGDAIRQLKTPGQPLYIVGHSFGGTLAIRTAMDHPGLADGLLVIAAPADPELSRPRWYHRLGNTLLVKQLIGKTLRQTNREMLILDKELEQMTGLWSKLTLPIKVIHGTRDFLVNIDNSDYIAIMASNADVTLLQLQGRGHFIPFVDVDMVSDVLIRLIEGTQSIRYPD